MLGFVSKKHDFGYKFIPKVACTSIKDVLTQYEEVSSFDGLRIVRRDYYKPWSFSNITIEGIRSDVHQLVNRFFLSDMDNCSKRYVVVRDPVKRFLSAYRNRVGKHGALTEENIRRRQPELYNKIRVFNPTLSEFIKDFDVYSKVQQIAHHSKAFSSFFDGNDINYFTDVYTMEHLHRFEDELSGIYGRKLDFPRKQTGGFNVSIKDLSKSELDQVIQLYEQDYVLLKDYYTPDDIIKEWK